MNVAKLDDYRHKVKIFTGNIRDFAINMVEGDMVLHLSLENSKIRFYRFLPNKQAHDLNKILLNSIIAKIPICIDAVILDSDMCEINDIGYYTQY